MDSFDSRIGPVLGLSDRLKDIKKAEQIQVVCIALALITTLAFFLA